MTSRQDTKREEALERGTGKAQPASQGHMPPTSGEEEGEAISGGEKHGGGSGEGAANPLSKQT